MLETAPEVETRKGEIVHFDLIVQLTSSVLRKFMVQLQWKVLMLSCFSFKTSFNGLTVLNTELKSINSILD